MVDLCLDIFNISQRMLDSRHDVVDRCPLRVQLRQCVAVYSLPQLVDLDDLVRSFYGEDNVDNNIETFSPPLYATAVIVENAFDVLATIGLLEICHGGNVLFNSCIVTHTGGGLHSCTHSVGRLLLRYVLDRARWMLDLTREDV
jgi:hypothetical protein